eukprot:COSAG05_NODE_2609_length_2840_cov_15.028092_3_plen_69_part_00
MGVGGHCAGTTAASLLSGIPIIVTPAAPNHAYHATQVQDLGVGVKLKTLWSVTVQVSERGDGMDTGVY